MAPKRKEKLKTYKKIHLVFNEEKRREFLSGFHKRKLQRKKKAKEKLEQDLKEEKKRLKAEARESYKKLVKSHTPIPEIENLLTEEYEDEDVNVKIVELSTNDIAKQNNWIGANQPYYESDNDEAHSINQDDKNEEVPGMELQKKSKKSNQTKDNQEPKSKIEIKRLLKKQATKNVQKSKAFQQKNKLEKQKQKKRALQQKKMKLKIQGKINKSRGVKQKR